MTKGKKKNRNPPELELRVDKPLKISAIRDLGMCCLLNGTLPGVSAPQRAFRIGDIQSINNWLFVFVPTLSNDDLAKLDAETQQMGIPVRVSCRRNMIEAPLQEFGRCMASKALRTKKIAERSGELTLEDLVHTSHLLEHMGYPQQGIKLDGVSGSSRAFALDCEMCCAGTSRVLTRIAVLDFTSEAVLLDTLVKPAEHITDYLTEFSGITPDMLQDVTTTLEDVQAWLQEHVGSTDILIGHSLESDLNVLRVSHVRCVDTVLLYPHHKGLPMRSSLKYLAAKFLEMNIQGAPVPGKAGHDPVEDALACVKLVKRKLERGELYGDTSGTFSFTELLSDNKLRSTIVDQSVPHWDADGTASVIMATSDTDAVAKSLKALDTNSFVFTSLSDPDVNRLGTQLSTLATDAPARTLLTIWNGAGDLTKVRTLLEKRRRTSMEYRTKKWDEIVDPWTDADDKLLLEAQTEAGMSMAYVRVTIGKNATTVTEGSEPAPKRAKSLTPDTAKSASNN